MTHLQRYLKLKKIKVVDMQIATGLGYSTLIKTIAGQRSARHVKEAIAAYLDLPYAHVWGVASARHLVKLIKSEIALRTEAEHVRLKSRFLSNRKERISEQRAVSNV